MVLQTLLGTSTAGTQMAAHVMIASSIQPRDQQVDHQGLVHIWPFDKHEGILQNVNCNLTPTCMN